MNEPLISITLDRQQKRFEPGQPLSGEYQIDAVAPTELDAVELSVLWYTEGKGDEDLAVHHFERLTNEGRQAGSLHEFRRFQTVLPQSPLSYEGVIVKICWCVRLRIFTAKGRSYVAEHPFQLGNVPAAQTVGTVIPAAAAGSSKPKEAAGVKPVTTTSGDESSPAKPVLVRPR